MRVVTYSRVSTSHHDQKPEVQVEELQRYCVSRSWTIAEEIIDHGYSGGSDTRPGLKRLMELVRTRQVDAVVVFKLDRLFRSLKHLITVLDEFTALGITFVAVRDQIDYTTPSGRLFVQMLGALGEFEKSLLIERVRAGLDHARRKGKTLGRPRVRPDEAIHALRALGKSYSEIAKELGITRGAVCRSLKVTGSKTPSE